ncbi:MAG: hypothetical protein LPH21_06345 [Shewanella sp.]|nr:hypothetical protein [Shewanella sp.]
MLINGYDLRHKLLIRFGRFFDAGYLGLWGQPCIFRRPIYRADSNIVSYWDYSTEPVFTTHPNTNEEQMEVLTVSDQELSLLVLPFQDPAFDDPYEGELTAHNILPDDVMDTSVPWEKFPRIDGVITRRSGDTKYHKFTRATMYDSNMQAKISLTMKSAMDEETEADLILRRDYIEKSTAFTLYRFSVRLW